MRRTISSKPVAATVHIGRFNDVDGTGCADDYASILDSIERLPHVVAMRERSCQILEVVTGSAMINPLIHYEIELASRQQEHLRQQAALWDLARQKADSRNIRPRWRWNLSAFATSMFGRALSTSRAALRRP